MLSEILYNVDTNLTCRFNLVNGSYGPDKCINAQIKNIHKMHNTYILF